MKQPIIISDDSIALIEGMELAMRICRNRAEDYYKTGSTEAMCYKQGAEECALLIRLVQVQFGAGRMPYPEFSQEEKDEMERIS